MTIENSAVPDQGAPKKRCGLRLLKWIALAVVLIVVIGVALVLFKLDEIVRRTVQTQSANSLNVPTQLQSANVSLLGGSVKLNNFDVGSPGGFKSPQMMSLGGIGVSVKLSELRDQPIRIASIDINDPKMVIEMQGTQFNIKKFIDSLPAGNSDPKPADGSEPIKLVIGNLNVSGAQVVFRPDVAALGSVPGIGKNLGGLKQEYVLSIPPLNLQNIGTGEGNQNGAAIKEVVSLLVTQLAAKAAQSNDLPPELRQVLSLNVNDLVGSLKAKIGEQVNQQMGKITADLTKNLPPDTAKAIEGVLKNPQQATTNPTQAIEQGLGGLLAPKDKKKPAK